MSPRTIGRSGRDGAVGGIPAGVGRLSARRGHRAPNRPLTRGLKGSEVAERAQQTFEEAVSRVRPAVESVITQLHSLAETPDEMHIEFGLDLHAEAGAFIAAVSTTANFTVALTWRRPPPQPQ